MVGGSGFLVSALLDFIALIHLYGEHLALHKQSALVSMALWVLETYFALCLSKHRLITL